jgi:hypothetical protein
MFNPTLIVIEAFINELRAMYERTYSTLEPSYPGVISFIAQLALETIATSDAAYHDVNHTILVTSVGQEILRGRHISIGGVTPRDWLHFIVSLLCHDIGYVRGICRGDGDGRYVSNLMGEKVSVPEGATDAAMAPYHIARSRLFVRERFTEAALIDLDIGEVEANIEHTRFPVPEAEQHAPTDDFPGLLRAADLIGQLADINYLRKTPALFNEFRETGLVEKLQYKTSTDLRTNYPNFFWQMVQPYIGDALRHLRVTQEGQQWAANLYANVFLMEHWQADSLGRSLGTTPPSR